MRTTAAFLLAWASASSAFAAAPSSTPPPVCDPQTQPSPHFGAKDGACLPSCGKLGGAAARPSARECGAGRFDAGKAYDVPYCCLPCAELTRLSGEVKACYDELGEEFYKDGSCGSAGEQLADRLDRDAKEYADTYRMPMVAMPGFFYTMSGCVAARDFLNGTPMGQTAAGPGSGPGAAACIPDGRQCGYMEYECGGTASWDNCYKCCNGKNDHGQTSLNCPGKTGVEVPHIWVYTCGSSGPATRGPTSH